MGNCCLIACLSPGVRGDEIVRVGDAKDPKYEYRDALNEKLSTSKVGAKRVKIILTKKEAALLLSNCKIEGGLVTCKLSQLQKVGITFSPQTASAIFPTNSPDTDSWKPTLESVSEEL